MIVESYNDIIILSGSLESNHWETIDTAIALTLKRHPSGVIIDLSGLTEITPEGAETFHDAMDFIRNHHARVILAAVPAHVMDVLKNVPEVRSQIPICDTVEDARRSLDLGVELEEDHGKKKKKLVAAEGARKLIVCLYDGTSVEEDNAAMEMASQIADSHPSEIHLVCALMVPRHLPLTAPLADSEESAANAMNRAKSFFNERNIPHVDRIERARDVASALAEVLNDIDAEIFVLPLIKNEMHMDSNLNVVRSVLGKIHRQVIFVRA
ncbi:MAG: STAS domain-containing protein [Fimbriimonadaceae bacterium]